MANSEFRSTVRRVRTPIVLVALASAILVALNSFELDARIVGPSQIAVRILIVLTVGWAVFQLTDIFWRRRLARLNLDVADNLRARQAATRMRVLRRMSGVLVVTLAVAAALTSIPWARQIGVSIFASAGIAGIAIGIAAQPVLSNLIAGLQIAFTQPMRIDDAVVVEGEWGWIEEIGLFHVVIRIWDWRRLVVPLRYFIDTPFQNWTYKSGSILGSVFWALDYRAPIEEMRKKLDEILAETDLWDGQAKVLQVTEVDHNSIHLRALCSARTSPEAWDLRCYVRERMITWLQETHPEALPRVRAEATVARAERGGGTGQESAPAQPPGEPTIEGPPPPDGSNGP